MVVTVFCMLLHILFLNLIFLAQKENKFLNPVNVLGYLCQLIKVPLESLNQLANFTEIWERKMGPTEPRETETLKFILLEHTAGCGLTLYQTEKQHR